MPAPPKTLLFCGKHRVNFAMFEPVYQLLRRDPRVAMKISSGRYRRRPLLGWIEPKDKELLNELIFSEFDIDPAHLARTGVSDPFPFDVAVSTNVDSKLQPRQTRATVQLFHGVSFRNFAVREEYTRFTRLFFPGRYHMEQYIARGYLKEGDPRIALIGMPKLDRLVDGSVTREGVLRGFELDPALPTVVWCPTGARHNSYEILGPDALRAIQDLGVNLIIKLHDHPHLRHGTTQAEVDAQILGALGARGRLATHSDVAPLLVAADALVSDASSVAYEYTLRDRPIVFADVPQLLTNCANTGSEAMDVNTHGRRMGIIASGVEGLREALDHALRNPAELGAERRAAAAHLFHAPGTAARRAADELLNLAGLEAASAGAATVA